MIATLRFVICTNSPRSRQWITEFNTQPRPAKFCSLVRSILFILSICRIRMASNCHRSKNWSDACFCCDCRYPFPLIAGTWLGCRPSLRQSNFFTVLISNTIRQNIQLSNHLASDVKGKVWTCPRDFCIGRGQLELTWLPFNGRLTDNMLPRIEKQQGTKTETNWRCSKSSQSSSAKRQEFYNISNQ